MLRNCGKSLTGKTYVVQIFFFVTYLFRPYNTVENVNEFADTIIADIRRELLTGNGDPAVLPDAHIVFEYVSIVIIACYLGNYIVYFYACYFALD